MNKVKILSIISIVLFIINIGLIVFIYSNNRFFGKHAGPKNIVIKKLHFNTEQIADYKQLINQHQIAIKASRYKMNEIKNELYILLQTTSQKDYKDSILNELNKVHLQIEQINFNHMQDIKQLCKPNQMNYFNEFCLEIATIFGPQNKRHEHGKH